ncbi:Helix-turn-helix domain-containing protein [Streptoalloteichus tenebrarius]|uniref:Helix-turn-helix domain-containing protein n=1 Tax=Streptoalloteichus tenebrarius (strain ATCC 17920 / DSM 40477 / JCM 4838 / CBS 697.72 / NBRC 16177 / NCIMB 11028 / NRRL B-12390 / A12253. 1 / ISP 5477) TaxID=1933 RepID=A0ABT1I3V3_STRSD|nr:helix-turn-helix transcriptional regulator [Streptoalloteichus tenebrarius]MCP2262467.1 Helix-turn-helix domain-containing protein [Streptoalloteichus tenebrarius]BFF01341.1 helix-turn-helix transcriptional regulator [Streptoalloteichus tenebrarius]
MVLGRQTVERRQLGLALRRLRSRTGASQQDAGNAIGRTGARISQVETGTGTLSVEELGKLLDFYGVNGDERATLLALGAEARKRRRQPWQVYTDVLPDAFQRLADLEEDATAISAYEAGIIPGLVQSPDYIRAIISVGNGLWWQTSDDETERRIKFRLQRQRRVFETGQSKRVHVIFTEDALDNVVGSTSVMRGQAAHLIQLTEDLPDLLVQVIPSKAAGNPALGGGMILLDFDGAPTIGFIASLYGPNTYYGEPEDIAPMTRVFQHLSKLALSTDESKLLFSKKMKEH